MQIGQRVATTGMLVSGALAVIKIAVGMSGHSTAVVADGFLYKMVRSIVGALVKVGEGRLSLAELARMVAKKFGWQYQVVQR